MNQQPPWSPQQQPPYGQQHYGQPQQSSQQIQFVTLKQNFPLLVLIIIFVTILVITLIVVTPSNSRTAQDTAKVGDTITVDGVYCTVLSVQGSSNSIDSGWVFVHIKLVNNSDSEIHYYASDFHIKTDSGSIIDGVSEGSSFQIISGSLAPGGSVDGNV